MQRSFRLSARTIELLDELADRLAQSRNGVAERLLDEGLRTERHPLIFFREGAGGLRRPALVGTRLFVWQVIDTLRQNDNRVAAAADYLGLSEQQIRGTVAYYADFTAEVDGYQAQALAYEALERERWERAERVLGSDEIAAR